MIGAGIAGLIAANRAAQLGKRVVVLEKSSEDKYLCNSRYAYGTFHINYSDLEANEDALIARIEAATEGCARKDLARAIAKDGRRLMQWLKSESIDVIRLDGYQTNVLAPAWRKGYGLTWQGYGSDIALQRLGANFEKRQGRILRGTPRHCAEGRQAGLVVETGQETFRAAAVVIADGGFQANLDMIRAYGISPAPDKLLARNGGTAIGDGMRWRSRSAPPSPTRHEQLLRPHAQPRRDEDHQAVAAALSRRTRGLGHRGRPQAAAALPTKASAASGCPTLSRACPIRLAPRSSSTSRSGTGPAATTCSRPIR